MKVFVTGPGGYIGGSVAARLAEAGHEVRGLVRSPETADAVRRFGIEPVRGSLDDGGLLAAEADRADAWSTPPAATIAGAVEALVEALAGSGKALLHTSGSSVVGDDARGEPSDAVFEEDTPIAPTGGRAARVAIDRFVVDAAERGVRSAVLCNTLIYGTGLGPHEDSIQIPALVHAGERERRAAACRARPQCLVHRAHRGRGGLYRLVMENPEARGFMFVENGEASFRDMVGAIGRRLGLGEPQPWPLEDAIREWGPDRATYALGSNSRVRGPPRARTGLGAAARLGAGLDRAARCRSTLNPAPAPRPRPSRCGWSAGSAPAPPGRPRSGAGQRVLMRRVARHQAQQEIAAAADHVALAHLRPVADHALEGGEHRLLLAFQPDQGEEGDLPAERRRVERRRGSRG